jgi:uncharacterized protein (DUF952 family)
MVTQVALLLHICSPAEWARAQQCGEHRPDSLRSVGFVHLSSPRQVHLPANRLYAGRSDLLLLHVDTAGLEAPLRWEPGDATDPASISSALRASGSSMVFPHLYGPLPVHAVVAVRPYRPGPDGRFAPIQSTT